MQSLSMSALILLHLPSIPMVYLMRQKLWKKSCYSTNVTLLLRPKAEKNGNNSLAMQNLMIDYNFHFWSVIRETKVGKICGQFLRRSLLKSWRNRIRVHWLARLIYNGNWTEWSAIWAALIHVIWNHRYDFRPKLHSTQFSYHFITSILKSPK